MLKYYAARAPEYDAIYAKPERQTDLRAIEQWLPTVFEGRTVLEVACGTGYWTQFIAPVCRRLIAVDAAPETLAVARGRVPPEKVQWVVGDAYALPMRSGAADAAFAGFWWSHLPRSRWAEFLCGLHAALQPGATVVVLDNRFVPGSSTPLSDTDEQGNTYQVRRLTNGTEHRVLKNFPQPDELLAAVQAVSSEAHVHQWQHFWALEYRVRA